MGFKTEDIDLEGPFTQEEVEYIGQRKRLRDELVSLHGNLDLLKEENWSDREGDAVPDDTPELTPQTGDEDDADDEDDEPEEYVPVDRSEWSQKELQQEVNERNEKIEEFNADVSDDEKWELLERPSSKAGLREVLETHDRLVWDANHNDGE